MSISSKYFQNGVCTVKVLFVAPVVKKFTCHTCLLVWCGCCGGFTAAVTVVLTDLSGSKFFPAYCHSLSTHLMDPVKVGSLTMYFASDISFSLKNTIKIRNSCLDNNSNRLAMFN